MRRRMAGLAFVLFAGACNALTGVDQLEVGKDPTSTTAGSPDGATLDGSPGSADAATSVDGGDTPLPACGASKVCVPNGAGWSPVVSPRQPTTPCPTEYGTSTDVVSSSTYDYCECSCSPTSPVSCPLRARVQLGGALCDGTTTEINFNGANTCTPYSPPQGSGGFLAFKSGGSGPTAPGCQASVTPHIQTPPPVRVCSGATGTADGCSADHLCVPAAPSNSRNCVVHDGDVQCPFGMNRRAVIGTSPTDTRACSSCSCGADNCAGGQLTGYPMADCSFGAFPLTANTCSLNVFPAYTFTPSNGCGVTTPPMVNGGLTFDAPKTICCQ